MSAFSPYRILHVQLPEALGLQPAPNGYVVLWWQKVPLGHVWIDAENKVKTQADLPSQILKAVTPAFDFYFAKADLKNAWKEAIASGDSEALRRLLQSNFTLQTFSNPHIEEQKISVVICTRNRTRALEHCIKALLQSPDKNFELVIVDNAPDDDSTEKLVQKFSNVRYVREPRKGLDIARNTGAQNASCAIVAYTDDDVTVDVDWIKNVKACFSDPRTMCVTGLVVPLELQTEAQYRFEKQWGFNKGYVPLTFDAAYFEKQKDTGVPVWDIGAGANMAFRKTLFDKIGYFDERLDVGAAGCSGDSEMWYRALAEGFQCNYFPHLFVYHQHRTSQAELDRQIFYYMRGQAASLLIQYEKYGHKGNLRWLYRHLPQWYKTRLLDKLRGRPTWGSDSMFTEIRGCVSGWRFYRNNRRKA